MLYHYLGESGLQVSRIALGCMSYGSPTWRPWVLDAAASFPFIERAIELGINFFDSAELYSNGESERILGDALHKLGVAREDVVLATKCFNGTHNKAVNRYGLSRKHIIAACDASLKRLGTDYIDLYQIHRSDPNTPYAETMDALHDLIRQGKVRYVGASSMPLWRFVEYQQAAQQQGWRGFSSIQSQYNLVYREEEREMMPYCAHNGVGFLPWSPLARGFLAGNRHLGGGGSTVRSRNDDLATRTYYRTTDFAMVQCLQEMAERLNVQPMQLALAWVLQRRPVVSALVGATKMQHLEQAVAALEVSLNDEDMATLNAIYAPKAVSGQW